MHTRATVTVAAALLAALTACTSDADSNKAKATTPVGEQKSAAKDDDRAALESSVRSYTKALFSGDGATGYKLLSARCKQEMTADQFQAMADQGHNDYGSLEIKTISVDQISGDLARVSYGVGVPQFERKAQPWAREDDVWRWDAC
ncbi:hypothetical protein [Streptomyces brasiliscabiei]|uniref:hypothetical protein n=1 Tax=Streptomyces brasiliscabiei TaxID=2736302 RepID=UPI001C110380|nr:hypothetical protein [Streptomyces brasiliscabiei]